MDNRHITVIGSDAVEEHQNKEDKAVVVGDKKYCPNDQRLLFFKPDIGCLFCADCGFTEGTPKQKSDSRPSILSEARSNDPNTISMRLIPMGGGRRTLARDEFSSDPETKALQMKGQILQESTVVTNEIGTISGEELKREKERMFSRNRSWSIR